MLIILIKPLTTKAYDRRASGDCGTCGDFWLWSSNQTWTIIFSKGYSNLIDIYAFGCEPSHIKGIVSSYGFCYCCGIRVLQTHFVLKLLCNLILCSLMWACQEQCCELFYHWLSGIHSRRQTDILHPMLWIPLLVLAVLAITQGKTDILYIILFLHCVQKFPDEVECLISKFVYLIFLKKVMYLFHCERIPWNTNNIWRKG